MSVIKAPYNFVPLNSKVVEPYWAPFISHDIPFKDGRSGTIQVTLKAHSPLFVRDPEKKEIDEDKKDKVIHHFSQNQDGEYFIPGSSLKGMIRSVMEIMTFSRMKMVNDHKFAYRDFHNKRLYDVSGISKTAESGWLYRDEHGEYHLEECGVPGRVRMDELDKLGPQSSLYSFFTKGEPGFGFNANKDQHKSAKFKYDQFSNPHPKVEVIPDRSGNNSRHDYRDKYEIKQLADDFSAQSGNKVGTLVLTGQPDARKKGDRNRKPSGKIYEFVFWDPQNTLHFGNGWGEEPKPIKDMKWAYLDQKNTDEQSIDWKYFKEKLDKGEKIPVFYHKRGSEITSMGLSLLYKFAYQQSVPDMIANKQGAASVSITDAIFGFTEKEDGRELNALKGRVHIGHAQGKKESIEVDEVKSEVLASPKASYYPTYIQQSSRNGRVDQYNTYNDTYASIAGWKRYPVRHGRVSHNPPSAKVSNPDKILTHFKPLKAGAEFTFQIQYHNLKPVELGALISALGFHQSKQAFHSLGMAKPLGYGKVQLTIDDIDQYRDDLKAFEAFMTASLGISWHKAPEVRELFTMATAHVEGDDHLEYMKLDFQEFAKAKKNREALSSYSKLSGVSVATVPSLILQEDIDRAKAIIQEEKTIYESKESMEKQLKSQLDRSREQFKHQLGIRQQQLLQSLQAQQEKIRKEHKAAAQKKDRQEAQLHGPQLESIEIKGRKDFKDQLEPVMKQYLNSLHLSNEAFEERKKSPTGLIPQEFHEDIKKIILEMARQSNRNDKKRWVKPFQKNNWLQVTGSWIGEDHARALLEDIQKMLDQ